MAKKRLTIENPDQEIYDAIVSFKAGAVHIRSTADAIVAIEFVSTDFPGASRPGRVMIVDDAPAVLIEACQQLKLYFAGNLKSFDLPVNYLAGSEFQHKVWQNLKSIPYGVTWSYEELAEKVIRPEQSARQMARAVGSACAANPLPIIIPCHRVIGKNGRLVGFAGGVELKAYLLNLEMFGV